MHWNECSLDLLYRFHYYCSSQWKIINESRTFLNFPPTSILACYQRYDKFKSSLKNNQLLELLHNNLHNQSHLHTCILTVNNAFPSWLLWRMVNIHHWKLALARLDWAYQLQSLKSTWWILKMEIYSSHACIRCLFKSLCIYKMTNGQFKVSNENVWRRWF